MKTKLLFCAYAVLAAAAAPVRAQQTPAPAASLPTVQLPAAMERVLRDYEAAWTARDAARLAQLFHPEGFVLSLGSPPVKGREAIQRHYQRAGGALHLRPIGYSAADTIAYIVGMYRGSGATESGKFLLALRRSKASQPWLIAADMDNTNAR